MAVDRQTVRDIEKARYLVGIDLGTTNSALAFIDSDEPERGVQDFRPPQITAPNEWDSRDVLPSFLYLAAKGEFSPGALRTPWEKEADPLSVLGQFARERGDASPGRLVQSAKSWLSHTGVDRNAKLLPWHAAEGVERMSPVEASAAYLDHFRKAWNHARPDYPLEHQDLVLTLPASFDELAREYTVAAAKQAGLTRVVLLEEPQAAFYAWLQRNAADWTSHIGPGMKILVCDIGGGTSDFTLIQARAGEGGKIQFHRTAVGPHLMLGGDNLDLALAKYLEAKLAPSQPLEPGAWSQLLQSSRRFKELFLSASGPEKQTLSIAGSSSRLIGGARQIPVLRGEVESTLLEGFLPRCRIDDAPIVRRSGFQEFGLPYAPDPAITKYLGRFLLQHARTGEADASALNDPLLAARPDIVLLNGGFFASTQLRARLLEVLTSWFAPLDANWRPLVLDNPRLDLAVAQGAAYFAKVRRGEGVSISSSLARSYYVGVLDENAKPAAVCLIPGHTEAGQTIKLERPRFQLALRTPVEFPLYVSSTRLADSPGSLLAIDAEQMTALPSLRTVISSGPKSAAAASTAVTLYGSLTEIGTLDLGCKELSGGKRWQLRFDVRSAVETDRAARQTTAERQGLLDEELIARACGVVHATFGEVAGQTSIAPKDVIKRLEEVLGASRSEWPASVLRKLWEELLETEAGRKRSPEHELRWLYLVGYALRPGFGLALDDWRVDQTRRLLWEKKLTFPATSGQVELLVLWRRIGAGLSAGQQRTLAEPHLACAESIGKKTQSKGREPASLTLERIRLLGSLEQLPADWRGRFGDELLKRLPREESQSVRDAVWWALARLGARAPISGMLHTVISARHAENWLDRILPMQDASPLRLLAVMQLARKTGDRFRDIDPSLRREVVGWLKAQDAPARYIDRVEHEGNLASEDETAVLGENLPLGLCVLGE